MEDDDIIIPSLPDKEKNIIIKTCIKSLETEFYSSVSTKAEKKQYRILYLLLV